MQNKNSPRLRKSLITLNKTSLGLLQRKRYFYCLKMLDILPPFSEYHKKWKYYSPFHIKDINSNDKNNTVNEEFTKVSPICLHDVLVGCHATSCQHGSLYFVFFHRHLIFLFQIFINFVHQILKNDLKYLKSVYLPSLYPQLYKDQQKWQILFKQYKQFNSLQDYISAHYWNPTNYIDDQDMVLPQQLKQKSEDDYRIDIVDKLCKVIRNSYPWEANVSTRWFTKGNDEKKLFKGVYTGIFTQMPNYQDSDRKLMKGIINIRQADDVDDYMKLFDKWIQKSQNCNLAKIYSFCKKSSNNFHQPDEMTFLLNSRSDQELKTGYYASSNNQHYISFQEAIKSGKSLSSISKYNEETPHFSFAQAFAGKDGKGQTMKQYIYPVLQEDNPNYIQLSHNTMHNNFRMILQDATYSICSLIFFPYHSWIDLMLEFKIRQSNQKKDKSLQHLLKNYLYIDGNLPIIKSTSNNLDNLFVNNNQKDKVNKQITNIFDKAIKNNSIQKKIDLNLTGSYPVCQWTNPDILKLQKPSDKDLNVAFFTSQYVINSRDGSLIQSRQISTFYKHYAQWQADNFKAFKSFKTFNFDYNFQVYDPKGNYQLNNSKLPSYIQIIIDKTIIPLNQEINKIQTSFIQSTAKVNVSPLVVQTKKSFLIFTNKQEQKKKENLIKIFNVKIQNEEKRLKKIIKQPIIVFVQYSPYLKNGLYDINFTLKNIFYYILDNFSQKQLEHYDKWKQNGLFLTYLNVFGKQSKASKCYKCLKNKSHFFQLDNSLRRNAIKVWKKIHILSLNQILFDSNFPQKPLNSWRSYVQLKKIDKIQMRLIQGAEQIQLKLVCNIKQPLVNQYVRVNAQLYSASKGIRQMIMSKKSDSFQNQFAFYKVFDVEGNNKKINKFDLLVYQEVRLKIGIDDKFFQYGFKIPNYSRLLRLKCVITLNKDLNLQNVKFFDEDYQLKKSYFQAFDL